MPTCSNFECDNKIFTRFFRCSKCRHAKRYECSECGADLKLNVAIRCVACTRIIRTLQAREKKAWTKRLNRTTKVTVS
jgi:hypothetical protein